MKRSLFFLIAAALIAASFTATVDGPAYAQSNPRECITNYDPNTDYFPEKATFEAAKGVTVDYFKNYKVVKVLTPWGGTPEPFEYVLVMCGTPAPTDPALAKAQVVEVPIKSIVSMSTTYLPHIVSLGVVDTLAGLDAFMFTTLPEVRARIDAKQVYEIGGGGQVNVELVVEKQPDLIMTFGSGFPEYDAHPKLIEAGLKVALNGDYMETTPLGRAEWGKFIGLFYNLEGKATEIYNAEAAEYNRLKGLVEKVNTRPNVLINAPFDGTWYIPGGASFAAQFIRDAGATYPWADDTSAGSLPLSIEVVLEKAQNTEFWLNPSGYTSLDEMQKADPRFAEFAPFKAGKVFNYTARIIGGGNDYFETGAAKPSLILADLIAILHPDVLPGHKLYFYQQLK